MKLMYSGLLVLCLISSFSHANSRVNREFGWYQGHLGIRSKDVSNAIKLGLKSGEILQEKIADLNHEKSARFSSKAPIGIEELHLVATRFQEDVKEESSESNLRTCKLDYAKYVRDLYKGEPYALKIFDSSGVRESGIIPGNWDWTGRYFECVQVETTEFNGKWCEVYQGDIYNPVKLGYPTLLSIGVCFPSSCNEESVEAIFPDISGMNVTGLGVYYASCTNPPSTLYTRDIIGITITAILLLLVVIATAFDMINSLNKGNQVEDTGTEARDRGVSVRLLLCFSAYTNTRKLLDMTKRKDNMTVLDGIRFMTMSWVILGHSFYFPLFNIDNASQAVQFVRDHPSMQILTNGTFSVDTFFCLGGFLVSLLTLRQLQKSKGKINIPLMYLHRYIRITPAYAYCILFVVSIYRWIGAGPFYPGFAESAYQYCKDDWWSNLLYISNLYPPSSCIGWVWYLANDMQFYIFSPFLLLLLYATPIVGISLLVFLILSSMSITGALANVYELQPDQLGSLYYAGFLGLLVPYSDETNLADNYKYDIYTKPYTRMGAYIVGMLAGYVIYRGDGKVRLHKAVVALGWLGSTLVSLTIIYGTTDYVVNFTFPSTDLAAFYLAVTRPAWSACIAWLIIACLSGYGGPITTFLSWKVFIPLSRLTFCAYLLHPLVLEWYTATQETEVHFLLGNIVYLYLGVIVLSFGFAYILTLMVEGPFMSMQKILFETLKPKPREERDNKNQHLDATNEVKMEKQNTNGAVQVIENEYATIENSEKHISKL